MIRVHTEKAVLTPSFLKKRNPLRKTVIGLHFFEPHLQKLTDPGLFTG